MFEYYQYVFQNWINQFPQFVQFFIWALILGLIIRIWFSVIKWSLISLLAGILTIGSWVKK